MDMKDYIGPFIDETEENLQKLNECLLAFEQGDSSVIDEIFRVAHTLKGMASTMGFARMAELTHDMEDVLDLARQKKLALRRKEDIELLFECLDTLNVMLDEIRSGKDDTSVDIEDIKSRLKALCSLAGEGQDLSDEVTDQVVKDQEGPKAVSDFKKIKVVLGKDCVLKGARAFMVLEELSSFGRVESTEPDMEKLVEGEFDGRSFVVHLETHEEPERIEEAVLRVSEVESCSIEGVPSVGKEAESGPGVEFKSKSPQEVAKEKGDSKVADTVKTIKKKTNQTVRVDVNRLDKLLNLVGELVIGRSRIERLAKDSNLKEFEEPILQLGRISKEIQELVTKLRMLPISFIFDRFPRLVRDLSQELGKKVHLEMEGRDTELDRSVIDEIGDPMVHLIRNSLDHGIEPPEERLAKGKPETGLLRIRAYQDGSSVVVSVEDDGRGIDKDKILQKALEKGFVSKEQLDSLTEREAIQFLFTPGFSTSDKVTDISGRGVGLDAVKNKVESIGGRLSIESEVDKGTTIKVKLPITLAIVLALLVNIDGQIYAIPLESVDETVLVNKDDIKVVNGSQVTMLRGSMLYLVDSRDLYGLPKREDSSVLSVVVMRTGFRKVGFIVDDFIGQQEIVIKSLGNTGMVKINWFSGGTILGDGSVALIIDPAKVEEV
ncbi:CheA signal transduction histidine kinase [Thermovirga lienii DSM 17291]|uniref:Chemotaxis protein CheA n=1 Tax=Thermovirga lienii (strain ATCC BAA-1197 / DSM 17291 / Cas60314) TaxID=580340 RepID=G7V5K3_THELD|nr:chemotaxis protein CheA [Thermovirga lienii]AER65830.1 CheA signal transduction histidine kinase [Thermovirga lienii DSM 17291]